MDKSVPFVVYTNDGERKVVGESIIQVDSESAVFDNAIIVKTVITDPETIAAMQDAHQYPHGFSIGLDPSKGPVEAEYDPMGFSTWMRRPFAVEAIEVTEANFEQIAEMTGEIETKQDGTKYISTNRKVVPNVFRIYLGFWLTRLDGNLRAYSAKTFSEMFEAP